MKRKKVERQQRNIWLARIVQSGPSKVREIISYLTFERSADAPQAHPGEHRTDFCLLYSTGSRYIYDLYYEKEAISKQLYDWLLKNGYADGNLIAKWKKQGYEKVCLSEIPLSMVELRSSIMLTDFGTCHL